MKKIAVFFFLLLNPGMGVFAQVGINNDNTLPDSSAMLDVKSSDKGFLPPRMTHVEINSIANPANGLIAYCTDCGIDGKGAFLGFFYGDWHNLMTCLMPLETTAGTNVSSIDHIIWNWSTVPGALGYKWNTVDNYATAIDLGALTTKTEQGLSCNTGYSRFIWTYNSCGISAPVTLSQVTATTPLPPVAGNCSATATQIIWTWHPVPGAIGYKWNQTNEYSSATDLSTDTAMTEINLSCATLYTRYAWAYSACGNSIPVTLTQTTTVCQGFICGQPITVNHLAGAVAPVDKSVTYGTVNNIPGETSKCWITQNLGATQQATAVSDATEASAGWNWQFNRKKGYKHDGSALTPAWTSSYINENSNWQIANDPCNLELGSSWRIPVYTEWYNVDNVGAWTNWNGPWSSNLKLHAAGYLYYSNGSLSLRGAYGGYWSSVSYDNTNSWYLSLVNDNCWMIGNFKAYGFSVRCLTDN